MVANAEKYAGLNTAGKARAIYDAELRHLEAEHMGEYLVLEVNTGDYEIDAEQKPAALRMFERFPDEDTRAICTFRIGNPPSRRRGLTGAAAAEAAEFVRSRAHAIYDAELRHLEAEHHGEYLVLNINTKEYELDRDHVQAALRMVERYPIDDDRECFSFRIGYPTAY